MASSFLRSLCYAVSLLGFFVTHDAFESCILMCFICVLTCVRISVCCLHTWKTRWLVINILGHIFFFLAHFILHCYFLYTIYFMLICVFIVFILLVFLLGFSFQYCFCFFLFFFLCSFGLIFFSRSRGVLGWTVWWYWFSFFHQVCSF